MIVNVKTFRDDALAEQRNGALVIRGVMASEFISLGRIPALGARAELEFKPGTVYKVFTGIHIEGISNPAQLLVRPTLDAFKHGAKVERVSLEGPDAELVVFVSTLAPFVFVRTEPLFDAYLINADPVREVKVQATKATVVPSTIPQIHVREEQVVAAKASPEDEKTVAKKVDDWINSAVEPTFTVVDAPVATSRLPKTLSVEEQRARGVAEMKL